MLTAPEPTVSSLAPAELARRLARGGIVLQTGAYTTHLESSVPSVAQGLALLYGGYALRGADAFADFHLRVVQPAGLRRWWRPQVMLMHNGASMFKPLPLAQAFPMFEWGLNWCVSSRAHDCLIVHAAVLERHGRALILPAPPGSGKSTLCAALAHRGWRLLSDELALIQLADGRLQPLPRPISLKNASIPLMQRYLAADGAVFSPPVADTVKGTVAHLQAPPASVARSAETAAPGWIVFPRYQAGAATELAPLPKAGTVLRVAENSFNYSLLAERGFDALAGLVDAAHCHSFVYSQLDEAVALFERLAQQP
ncbi:HprK-related kinase A [Pseudoduganella aquatica]|uniref:HprK-related kinase A n=1 Tax=Pseudoduganella aquatica TaxID=2660641 RepID=A0A7X4HHQ8_9BURK|nr:HprK-related kinase A [Pseudoduganella aquatica]MYN11224.1 HprK-related kinase A [Pseudoduganella aquatica]